MKLFLIIALSPFVTFAQVAFPEDTFGLSNGEYDAEEAMKSRATKVMETCNLLNDFLSPVHLSPGWMNFGIPTRGDALIFDRTEPNFQVCSPKQSFLEAWSKYRDSVNSELPEKKKKDKDPSKFDEMKSESRKYYIN